MFEWRDGNPRGEDRRGYFVTVRDGLISIADADDKFVAGVVSGSPAIASDSQGCNWHDMYLRDEFGGLIYEWAEEKIIIPLLDESRGGPKINAEALKIIRVRRPKLNPAYDPDLPYIPRTRRVEWAAVGLIGKLVVRDDGSCMPNGFCRPGICGLATSSDDGWLVLKRISADKVLIFLK